MHGRATRRRALPLAILATLGACGQPEELPPATPWEMPVDRAVAVTGWTDDGEPTSPFGPGGVEWSGASEIVEAIGRSFAQSAGGVVSSEIVGANANGATIGWVRVEIADAPVLAMDMRLEMRNEGGSWHVARTWTREHCARELEDGRCE